jgi:hypothetical protein
MKRLAFPVVMMAILVTGLMFGGASKAARSGISEEALLRSGHTVDHRCGTVAPDGATADGEPIQLAASIKCEKFSSGSCVSEGTPCGLVETKRAGRCTTVINKHKRTNCACVK